MGRYPKAPGQTRRPDRSRWRTLGDSTTVELPPLPDRTDGQDWTTEAVQAWASWWSSPMASMWLDADTVALRRAIVLVDDAQRGRRGVDAALVALLDRLGLTPSGRQRLQWQSRRSQARARHRSCRCARGDPRKRR